MDEKRLQEIELLVFESPDAVPLSVSMELAKEVRRLRELVKDAEWNVEGECTWCGTDNTGRPAHADGCPAFLPYGSVR